MEKDKLIDAWKKAAEEQEKITSEAKMNKPNKAPKKSKEANQCGGAR